MIEEKIIVNATALDGGGALSILRQFVLNIPENEITWLVFISPEVKIKCDKSNVRLQPIEGVKSLFKRFWWDCMGLKRWLINNRIEPLASISLQNTGFNIGKKVPSFIYYHQAIPFYRFFWNPLRKRERTLWFYKNIYPFFVKLFLKKDTHVFVQLNYIKKGFVKKFNHPFNLVNVFSPDIAKIEAKKKYIEFNYKCLFYPASNVFYKNHQVLYEALQHLDEPIELYLTIEGKNDNKIQHLGALTYERVCEIYERVDALVFPSYIETYGLPLIEAAMSGLPIIAADLPYSREVLNGYDGVEYVSHQDSNQWVNSIKKLQKNKRYQPLNLSDRPGWKDLFDYILNKINYNNVSVQG